MLALNAFVVLACSLPFALSHGPNEDAPVHWKRDHLEARVALDKRCGTELARRQAKRSLDAMNSVLERRDISKRDVMPRQTSNDNSLCMVTPEVTQGPYHVLAEIVRQNITEDQAGIPLQVEVDFIDINTCQYIPNLWVDMWGYYAHYIAETGGSLANGGGFGGGSPDDSSMSGSMTAPPSTATESSGASASAVATSYGPYDGADAAAAADQLNTAIDDSSTFLRGVWKTDETGHLTAYSIVPGWYSGRAQHFHIKVFPEGYIADNGTFIANTSAVHTGQFFYDNETLEAVAASPSYAANAIEWGNGTVANEDDQWYPYQSATGYDADMQITWVGSELTDGLIGSIVVALNMSYESIELSTQYSDFNVTEYLAEGKLPYANGASLP